MAWFYLALAGLFEIGRPLGFKLSRQPEYRMAGIAGAIWSMGMSGWLLWLAQREIPIGNAYVVWTGIGGVPPSSSACCFSATRVRSRAGSVWR